MAKGFKGQGKYSTDRGDADCFKRDTSFHDNARRAGEGETTGSPKFPDYAGGMQKQKKIDADLSYSGGNDGHKGGE